MTNTTKRKMMLVLMTLTAVTAGTVLSGCGTAKENPAPVQEEKSEVGDPVAQAESTSEEKTEDTVFSAMDTTTLDGEKVDASVFAKNKVTLVNLWNVGCTPCVEEIPVLDKLNKEYEGKDAAIMGLYFADPEYLEQERPEIEEILSKAGAEYPQLTLSKDMSDSETIKSVQAFPTTYVVDAKGNIVNKREGSNDYDGWKAFIEEELKKADAHE